MMLALADSLLFSADLNGLFSKMFEDTVQGKVSFESVLMVGGFFGLFVGMVALGMFVTRKPEKRLLDIPSTWITDYARISELLDAAVVQRCKMRVSFHRDLGAARSTDGTLRESTKDGLVLEIPSLKTINNKWIGRSLDLGFRMKLPDQPNLQSNFGFMTDITGFEQVQEDITLLRLSRPLRLEFNQNRQHLRVEPPEKYVRALKIWTEDAMRRRAAKLQDPDSWGEPTYISVAGGVQEVELENLSGGGIRVEILPHALREKNVKLSLNMHLACVLTLSDIGYDSMTSHYLMCQVVKCFDDCESKTKLSLGLLFTGVGSPQAPPLAGLRWRSVVRDFGVYELDNWAYELHLDMYRNRGLG